MSEKTLETYFRNGLFKRADLWKHNDVGVGIADFSAYFRASRVTRWIELKAAERWPVKGETRVWWEHYTEHQMLFLRARRGWLFVRIGKDYFLFDWIVAAELWAARGFTRSEMYSRATKWWVRSVAWREFERVVV